MRVGLGVTVVTMLLLICDGASAQPKNAILFVGDGMGVAQTTAARVYQKNARDGRLTLDTFRHVALVRTYSANTMVTDSAAAATALASGHKTNALMVGQLPDGTPVSSVLQRAKSSGRSVGIVTNTTVSHATPAAFYAHSERRSPEAPLVDQLIAYGEIDLVLGGGRRYFLSQGADDPETGDRSGRGDDRDMIEEARGKGYRYIQRLSEFEDVQRDLASVKKLLGLFSSGAMAYELERGEDRWGEPSLEQMTRLAIAMLQRNPEGYFLMVEGGRIDHGGHENKALHVVHETLAFDRAIAAALELTQNTDDTLIVVTADHETGGLAINGYADVEVGGVDMFSTPAGLGGDFIVTFATGPGADGENQGGLDREAHDYRQPAAVKVTPAVHTGVDVVAYAAGPGADSFFGTLNNSDIGQKLIALLGLN